MLNNELFHKEKETDLSVFFFVLLSKIIMFINSQTKKNKMFLIFSKKIKVFFLYNC